MYDVLKNKDRGENIQNSQLQDTKLEKTGDRGWVILALP